jgi:hypothetical protein
MQNIIFAEFHILAFLYDVVCCLKGYQKRRRGLPLIGTSPYVISHGMANPSAAPITVG